MIPRRISATLLHAAESFPIVTLLGPRQSGKTTLVQALFPDHLYINLENPETRALFASDPKELLLNGSAPVIVDEAQREPEILSWIQVFSDRSPAPGHFVVTGSNQPELGQALSQSLAGRTSVHTLLPLSLDELIDAGLPATRNEALVNGFLPRRHSENIGPQEIYRSYFATYVERDVRRLINVKDMTRFETFVRLLAGRIGSLVSLSSLAGDVGVSSTTLAGWLSALEASFIVFRLPPFFANIQKRLIKTPKLYFTEPGLAAWLLQIESAEQAARDPLLGGLFENMVIVEALKGAYNRGLEPRLSFYRDRTGLEIDLIREYHRRPFAVEIKASGTFTREMLRNLHRFRELLPDREGEALIYSGEDERRIDGVSLIPFTKTARLLFGSTAQGP